MTPAHTHADDRDGEDLLTEVEYFSDGHRISAFLSLPDADRPVPAVVFCPGFTGTKYAAFYRPYVKRLREAGVAVLLIDYRGWGRSEGRRGDLIPLEQAADIRNGLSYLESREDIDGSRLGLFGVSFGGGHASYVAGVDERVRATVAISGVADGEDWLRRMRRGYEWREFKDRLRTAAIHRAITGEETSVSPTEDIMIPTPERRETNVKGTLPPGMVVDSTRLACAEAIIDYRPVEVVARIGPRAGLWICVEDDVVVPADHSAAMFERATGPKRHVILPGRMHYGAYVEHETRIMDEAVAWYREHLPV